MTTDGWIGGAADTLPGDADTAALAGRVWDPVADGAFLDALSSTLRADIPFEAIDAHVDDHQFADIVATRYLSLVPETIDA